MNTKTADIKTRFGKRLKQITRGAVALSLVGGLVTMSGSGLTFAQQTPPGSTAGVLAEFEQDNAPLLSSDWQSIAPGEANTFTFNYAGGNMPVLVWMDISPVGTPNVTIDSESSAGFQIWTPEELALQATGADVSPVGVGRQLDSSSMELFWYANFTSPATYVVVVTGDTSANYQYMLHISGTGLAVAPTEEDADLTPDDEAATAATAAAEATDTTGTTGTIVATPETTTPATVSEPAGTAVVLTNALNVREGASTEFPILTVAPQGTQMNVLGRDAADAWILVQLTDGTQGWVSRTLTDFIGTAPLVETPALPADPIAVIPTPTPVTPATGLDATAATVTAAALNVRQGPAITFPIVTTLSTGTGMTVTGRDDANVWIQVQLADGSQGWVTRTLTDYTGTAPVVQTPPMPAEPVEPITVAPPTVAPADDAPVTNVATIATPLVNVRQGPATTFPVITQLAQGTNVTVVGRDAANAWILVETGLGVQGWLSRGLTNYVGLAPIVETPPLPAVPAATVPNDVAPLPGDPDPLVDPPVEQQLEQNWFALDETEAQWFTFNHIGDDQAVHIWMEIEPNEGAGFRVFDEERAMAIMAGGNPDDFSEIGRGTPNPEEPGNLFWRGVFGEPGTFYVWVEHGWEGQVLYSVYAAGPGLQ